MNICITGGGTGGHLMIAQALLEAAIARGHKCFFIGSTHGQDQKYFADSSSFEAVYFLKTTGVVNQKGLGKLGALFKILKAFFRSRELLKLHKIDAVYSVGGFSAAPAAIAALSSKTALFIHEQNAVTGRLNALLKPYAKSFLSAYDTEASIKGYPVKKIFYESARVRDTLKKIIFLGGSHGARAINDLALSVARNLVEKNIAIIHQAGEADFARVKAAYEQMGIDVALYAFTTELPRLIGEADLAVSRAGASTLWELTTNALPALYIPYPYAAGDHQYYNAKFLVDGGMGWSEREGAKLQTRLLSIVETPDIKKKSEKLYALANTDVADAMIQAVEDMKK